MKDNEKQMYGWIKSYYTGIYKYVCNSCHNSEAAAAITGHTLEAAYKYMRKLRNMDENQRRSWIMRTARYYIVKEIYESWERGENVTVRYHLAGKIDPEQYRRILKEYEANPFLDGKKKL